MAEYLNLKFLFTFKIMVFLTLKFYHKIPFFYYSVAYFSANVRYYGNILKPTANWSPYILTLVQKVKRRVYKIHVFF